MNTPLFTNGATFPRMTMRGQRAIRLAMTHAKKRRKAKVGADGVADVAAATARFQKAPTPKRSRLSTSKPKRRRNTRRAPRDESLAEVARRREADRPNDVASDRAPSARIAWKAPRTATMMT
jgi:hypothetical protein